MKKIFLFSIFLAGIYGFSAVEAKAQCKNYLGRAGEKLCETQADYNQCVLALKQGSLNFCLMSGNVNSAMRRSTPEAAEADLIKRGCKKLGGNVYECSSDLSMSYCNAYRTYFQSMVTFPKPGEKITPAAVKGCQAGKSTTTTSNPVPSTLEGGNLYIFATGNDDRLWAIKKSFGEWGKWMPVGKEPVSGGPDACSSNPGKVLVMYRNSANALYARTFDSAVRPLGAISYLSKVGSDPSVACQAGDKVGFFVRAHNNTQLYATYAENGVWAMLFTVKNGNGLAIEDVAAKAGTSNSKSFWSFLGGEEFSSSDTMLGASSLGGGMKGSPDAAAYGGNTQAVFVRGADDNVWWRISRDGKPWEQFVSLGGMKISSDPAALSRKTGEFILFARGLDNKLYVRQYLNGNWTPWFPWGGMMAGGPDAATWGGNRMDVVYRGSDGSVYHAWRDDPNGIISEPRIEKVPGMTIKGDPTIVAAQW